MRKHRDTLKNPEQEVRIFRNRSLLAALVVILLSGGLVARLIYLQVFQHEVYTTRSESNRVRVEPLPPTRGLIFDRNGVLLAENQPTYNLTIVRERVDDLKETLALLVDILRLPEDQVAQLSRTVGSWSSDSPGRDRLREHGFYPDNPVLQRL